MGMLTRLGRTTGKAGTALRRVSRRWWIIGGVAVAVIAAGAVALALFLPRDSAQAAETSTTATVGGSSSGCSSTGGTTSGGDAATMGGTTSTSTTSSTSSGIKIVGLDAWTVEVTASETDVADIAVGEQVELTTGDGDSFFGVVDEVGLLPSTTTGAALYPITLRVTGSPEGLHEGISVTAEIITTRRMNVLSVPSDASSTADGAMTVTVLGDDGAETGITVETGETSGSYTEVLSGLAEGDQVVDTPAVQSEGGEESRGSTSELPGGSSGEMPQPPSGGGFPGQ